MITPCGVITLTTDFGVQDSYVGTMKGVILRINPQVQLVDLTHQISPQSVLEASLVLESAYRYFPIGTVHLTVVDPGVGTHRRAILVVAGGFFFVGPDNGIFTRVLEGEDELEVYTLENARYSLPKISDTFHGRDVFAPVAAYLTQGVAPEEFGRAIDDPVRLSMPKPRRWGNELQGEVISVDSFGNVVTNISRDDFERAVQERSFSITINGKSIEQIHRTYQEADVGHILALFGSSDLLEIAVAGGRADRRLGVGKGDPLVVAFRAS